MTIHYVPYVTAHQPQSPESPMIARLMPALLHRLTRFASAPVAVLLALTTLMLTLASTI